MGRKQEDWDIYFLKIAKEISGHSKCFSRKIGAVLVRDKSIISTGYNGPARGVSHCNERGLDFYADIDGKPHQEKFALIQYVLEENLDMSQEKDYIFAKQDTQKEML